MVERNFWYDADPARGQGVTTDGTNWFFSGTHSLEITDENFNTIRIDPNAIASQLAIPSEFSSIGLNHIGDIDYANGLLYISLDLVEPRPGNGNREIRQSGLRHLRRGDADLHRHGLPAGPATRHHGHCQLGGGRCRERPRLRHCL